MLLGVFLRGKSQSPVWADTGAYGTQCEEPLLDFKELNLKESGCSGHFLHLVWKSVTIFTADLCWPDHKKF